MYVFPRHKNAGLGIPDCFHGCFGARWIDNLAQITNMKVNNLSYFEMTQTHDSGFGFGFRFGFVLTQVRTLTYDNVIPEKLIQERTELEAL